MSESTAGMKRVQTPAAAPRATHHPATRVATLAGADRLRRRLSAIFQRPMSGVSPWFRAARGPLPKIHGNSCQSPRTQRCWRDAATS